MSELPAGWARTPINDITRHHSGNSKLIKGKLFREPKRAAIFPHSVLRVRMSGLRRVSARELGPWERDAERLSSPRENGQP